MDSAPVVAACLRETPWAVITDGKIVAAVGTTVRIPLEYIVPNPNQPRQWFDSDELSATAETYEHRGDVEKAIDVTLRKDDTIAFIMDGESRWRAAKLAKLVGISCYICPDMSDNEVYLSSAVSNIRRRDFTIIEKALAIFQLQQRFKLNQMQAGKLLGFKSSQTTYLLKFLDLIEELQMLLMRGKIGSGIAHQLASCPPDLQKVCLSAIVNAVKENEGKPIHQNKAARIIRKELESRGVKQKQLGHGRKQSTHAELVAKNLFNRVNGARDALREFATLAPQAVKELENPHFLDVEKALQNFIGAANKELERLSCQA